MMIRPKQLYKRLLSIMLSFLLAMAYLPSSSVFTSSLTAAAEFASAEISTGSDPYSSSDKFSATAGIYSDEGLNNQIESNTNVSNGQPVYINFDWKLDQSFTSENEFTIRFNPGFKHALMSAHEPVTVNNDQCTAVYSFEDGYVYIKITPKPGHFTNFKGSGVIYASVDASEDDDNSSFELEYMGETVSLKIPEEICDIRKQYLGNVEKPDGIYAQFKVTINNGNKNRGQVYVLDTFPTNSIYVYDSTSKKPVIADFACNSGTVSASDIVFDEDGGIASMKFPAIENLAKNANIEYTYSMKLDSSKINEQLRSTSTRLTQAELRFPVQSLPSQVQMQTVTRSHSLTIRSRQAKVQRSRTAQAMHLYGSQEMHLQ